MVIQTGKYEHVFILKTFARFLKFLRECELDDISVLSPALALCITAASSLDLYSRTKH
jgi:hypothetical protein